MRIDPNAALLPIDLQRGFDHPPWSGRIDPTRMANAEHQGLRLLELWRERHMPIVHVRHDSLDPASPLHPSHAGHAFRAGFTPMPGEPLVAKSVNCAFIGTDLELRLRRMRVSQVVIFGLTTDMCVSTTARVANNLGFASVVVGDASCAGSLRDAHAAQCRIDAAAIEAAHLATLHAEFACVANTATIAEALITEVPMRRSA